jgi:antitoxin FitA
MTSITIRRMDDALKSKLRVRAAQHGHSMEQEAREILRAGLSAMSASRPNLAESIRARVAPFGGVDLRLPKRQAIRRPPEFRD